MNTSAVTLLGVLAVGLLVVTASAGAAAASGEPPTSPNQTAASDGTTTPDDAPPGQQPTTTTTTTTADDATSGQQPTPTTTTTTTTTTADDASLERQPTTTAEDDGVSPGQQLSGAVGAQGAAVEGELWNRTLSERLANATTPEERASVLADEVETIEAYIESLESARANLTSAWNAGEISESEYRASLSSFVVRARTVERRADRTAEAVGDLPADVRAEYGLSEREVLGLSERAHQLYQFEDEIAQEVVAETLNDESENRDASDEW